MLELAVIVLRLIQYGAASILTGSALLFLYGLPVKGPASAAELSWSRPLLLVSALSLTLAALLGLLAQTAVLAGSFSEGLKAHSLVAVIAGMDLGKAAVARAGLACVAAVVLLVGGKGRPLWAVTASLGALATVSFGWMGHGAATDGPGHLVHLIADILHALAAVVWLGSLVAFVVLVWQREQSPEQLRAIQDALQRFSAVGLLLVGVLLTTGLLNSWFLLGLKASAAWGSAYGQLLALKLALFAGMLGFAALHRRRSVPALARQLSLGIAFGGRALEPLRWSLTFEAGLGLAVLGAVAWLGTLSPPA